MGRDNHDVTENYQYHHSFIEKQQIKLTYSDKFYREAFRPMHLMHFTYFNKLLDDFLVWYGVQRGPGARSDLELVALDKFIQYFEESQKKMFDRNGPMLRVLKFRGIFVKSKEQLEASGDSRFDESEVFFSTKGNQGKLCLDLFCLRVLSLVICRGHYEDKAIFLARVITKNNHDGIQKYMVNQGVYWNNERFKRAIRLIVRFSTTLPIMFLRAHHHHDVFKQILKKQEEWNDKLWTSTSEYKSEANFEDAFEKFMEEKVVAQIFPTGVEYISHDEFVARFTRKNPSIFKKRRQPSVEWLFSPVGVYFNYRPYVDEVNK